MRSKSNHTNPIRNKSVLACVLVAIAVLVVAGVAVGTSVSRARATIEAKSDGPPATQSYASAPAVVPNAPAQNRLEAERITIRQTGFEPAEITRPAGRFLLAVNDRSGIGGLRLTLLRDTGQRLHTTRMRDNPRKHEWRKVVDLPPGRYVLSEASHPEWMCRITLTAN